jgi:hypothetical protein
MEIRGAGESFTWGPHCLLLLCGLVWLFLFVMRDTTLAKSALANGIAAAMLLLAVLALGYAIRRHKRRIVLFPSFGEVGLYRGGVFQYSFRPAEIAKYRLSIINTLQMLVPMLLLIGIAGFLMYDTAARHPGKESLGDKVLFVYVLLFAVFAFVALFRSRLLIVWYWIPDSKGRANKSIGFSRQESRKLQLGS